MEGGNPPSLALRVFLRLGGCSTDHGHTDPSLCMTTVVANMSEELVASQQLHKRRPPTPTRIQRSASPAGAQRTKVSLKYLY